MRSPTGFGNLHLQENLPSPQERQHDPADQERSEGIEQSRYDCPDALIGVWDGGHFLLIHDGGTSGVEISFCPWCGKQLKAKP